jgi:hypothetical protein
LVGKDGRFKEKNELSAAAAAAAAVAAPAISSSSSSSVCALLFSLSLSRALLFCDAFAAAFSVRIYHHRLEARVFC